MMKTSKEMVKVSLNNSLSSGYLYRAIRYYAEQGKFEEVFYGSAHDYENMKQSAKKLTDSGFKAEVVLNEEEEDKASQYELRVSWHEDLDEASNLYKGVRRTAVYHKLYLNSEEGILLRDIAEKVEEEAQVGKFTVTVPIPKNTSWEIVERTKAILESEPLSYICSINTLRTKMTIDWE